MVILLCGINWWDNSIENEGGSGLHVSCQNQRSKHLNFQYIYPISYKIAKKRQTPEKGFAPLKNDITGSELALKYGIAGTCNIEQVSIK